MNLVRSLMMMVSLHWMRASLKSSNPSASKCIPGGNVCGGGGWGGRRCMCESAHAYTHVHMLGEYVQPSFVALNAQLNSGLIHAVESA